MKKGDCMIHLHSEVVYVESARGKHATVREERSRKTMTVPKTDLTPRYRPALQEEVFPEQTFWMRTYTGLIKVEVWAGDLRYVNPGGYHVLVTDQLRHDTHRATLSDLLVDEAAQIRNSRD